MYMCVTKNIPFLSAMRKTFAFVIEIIVEIISDLPFFSSTSTWFIFDLISKAGKIL